MAIKRKTASERAYALKLGSGRHRSKTSDSMGGSDATSFRGVRQQAAEGTTGFSSTVGGNKRTSAHPISTQRRRRHISKPPLAFDRLSELPVLRFFSPNGRDVHFCPQHHSDDDTEETEPYPEEPSVWLSPFTFVHTRPEGVLTAYAGPLVLATLKETPPDIGQLSPSREYKPEAHDLIDDYDPNKLEGPPKESPDDCVALANDNEPEDSKPHLREEECQPYAPADSCDTRGQDVHVVVASLQESQREHNNDGEKKGKKKKKKKGKERVYTQQPDGAPFQPALSRDALSEPQPHARHDCTQTPQVPDRRLLADLAVAEEGASPIRQDSHSKHRSREITPANTKEVSPPQEEKRRLGKRLGSVSGIEEVPAYEPSGNRNGSDSAPEWSPAILGGKQAIQQRNSSSRRSDQVPTSDPMEPSRKSRRAVPGLDPSLAQSPVMGRTKAEKKNLKRRERLRQAKASQARVREAGDGAVSKGHSCRSTKDAGIQRRACQGAVSGLGLLERTAERQVLEGERENRRGSRSDTEYSFHTAAADSHYSTPATPSDRDDDNVLLTERGLQTARAYEFTPRPLFVEKMDGKSPSETPDVDWPSPSPRAGRHHASAVSHVTTDRPASACRMTETHSDAEDDQVLWRSAFPSSHMLRDAPHLHLKRHTAVASLHPSDASHSLETDISLFKSASLVTGQSPRTRDTSPAVLGNRHASDQQSSLSWDSAKCDKSRSLFRSMNHTSALEQLGPSSTVFEVDGVVHRSYGSLRRRKQPAHILAGKRPSDTAFASYQRKAERTGGSRQLQAREHRDREPTAEDKPRLAFDRMARLRRTLDWAIETSREAQAPEHVGIKKQRHGEEDILQAVGSKSSRRPRSICRQPTNPALSKPPCHLDTISDSGRQGLEHIQAPSRQSSLSWSVKMERRLDVGFDRLLRKSSFPGHHPAPVRCAEMGKGQELSLLQRSFASLPDFDNIHAHGSFGREVRFLSLAWLDPENFFGRLREESNHLGFSRKIWLVHSVPGLQLRHAKASWTSRFFQTLSFIPTTARTSFRKPTFGARALEPHRRSSSAPSVAERRREDNGSVRSEDNLQPVSIMRDTCREPQDAVLEAKADSGQKPLALGSLCSKGEFSVESESSAGSGWSVRYSISSDGECDWTHQSRRHRYSGQSPYDDWAAGLQTLSNWEREAINRFFETTSAQYAAPVEGNKMRGSPAGAPFSDSKFWSEVDLPESSAQEQEPADGLTFAEMDEIDEMIASSQRKCSVASSPYESRHDQDRHWSYEHADSRRDVHQLWQFSRGRETPDVKAQGPLGRSRGTNHLAYFHRPDYRGRHYGGYSDADTGGTFSDVAVGGPSSPCSFHSLAVSTGAPDEPIEIAHAGEARTLNDNDIGGSKESLIATPQLGSLGKAGFDAAVVNPEATESDLGQIHKKVGREATVRAHLGGEGMGSKNRRGYNPNCSPRSRKLKQSSPKRKTFSSLLQRNHPISSTSCRPWTAEELQQRNELLKIEAKLLMEREAADRTARSQTRMARSFDRGSPAFLSTSANHHGLLSPTNLSEAVKRILQGDSRGLTEAHFLQVLQACHARIEWLSQHQLHHTMPLGTLSIPSLGLESGLPRPATQEEATHPPLAPENHLSDHPFISSYSEQDYHLVELSPASIQTTSPDPDNVRQVMQPSRFDPRNSGPRLFDFSPLGIMGLGSSPGSPSMGPTSASLGTQRKGPSSSHLQHDRSPLLPSRSAECRGPQTHHGRVRPPRFSCYPVKRRSSTKGLSSEAA